MQDFLQLSGAINDETRVRLLNFIDKNGEVCVCDIESSFLMIQSRVSRHLKILRDSGFLTVERRGKWAYYSINNKIDEFKKLILKEINSLNMDTPILIKAC